MPKTYHLCQIYHLKYVPWFYWSLNYADSDPNILVDSGSGSVFKNPIILLLLNFSFYIYRPRYIKSTNIAIVFYFYIIRKKSGSWLIFRVESESGVTRGSDSDPNPLPQKLFLNISVRLW